MSIEYESFTLKRQITPEPNRKDFKTLGKIQENLRLAACTIEALQLERDKLKLSFNSVVPKSSGFFSKEASSEETEEFKRLLEKKKKDIEKLEKKLIQARVKSADLKTLQENNEKLKKDVLLKEKNIAKLEKTVRELRLDFYTQSSVTENPGFWESDRRTVESLQKENFELQQAKKSWEKIVEIIGSISDELVENKVIWERGKDDWEMAVNTIVAMKSLLDDKEMDTKVMVKVEEEKVVKELREANRRLLENLEARRLNTREISVSDLREVSSRFIRTVQLSQVNYSVFKKHLYGSSFFKSLIESQHSEALIRILRFAIEALEQGSQKRQGFRDLCEEVNIESTYTPREKIRNKIELDTPNRRVSSPSDSGSATKLNTWTQTKEIANNKQPSYRTNKEPQNTFDRNTKQLKPPRVSCEAKKNFSFPEADSGKHSEFCLEKPTLYLEQEGFIKLFDESEQLLTIIDKQSSRLSKINNQISNLVPTAENLIELSSDSEDNKEFKKNYLKAPRSQYEEGTFGRVKVSLNTDSEKLKVSQNSEKVSYYINVRLDSQRPEIGKGFPETSQFDEVNKKINLEESKVVQSSIEKTIVNYEDVNDAEGGLYFDLKASSDDLNESVDGGGSEFNYNRGCKNPENLNEGCKKNDPSIGRYNKGRVEDRTQDYWNSVVDYFSNQEDESN